MVLGFGLGHYVDQIAPHAEVSVIGELSVNEWNNIRKPQIFVQDVSVEHWQLFDYRGKGQAEKWLAEIPAQNRKIVVFSKNTLKSDILFYKTIRSCLISRMNRMQISLTVRRTFGFMDMPPLRSILKGCLHNKKPLVFMLIFIMNRIIF